MYNTTYNGTTPPFEMTGMYNEAGTMVPQGFANQPNMAIAVIRGGPLAPDIRGTVIFKSVPGGTEVTAEIAGLPAYRPAEGNKSPIGPHGFHIHDKSSCEIGEASDPFKAAGGHWNPYNQPHGNHAGDFPVLFSNNGYAKMTFLTNKFKVNDVIGKTVLIHENPDDYRTEPAGNSGKRLACGTITPAPYRYPCQYYYNNGFLY